MTRHLQGTAYVSYNLRPKIQTQDKRTPLNIDTCADANWASCETTRKSASGFEIHFFGAAKHSGSRTQATIALSPAESVRTVAQESLYISNFTTEAFEVRTNISIHTDSSAAKSVTVREGASKKAKHMELGHLYAQQLVKNKTITTHKVKSEDNPADTLTKFVRCHPGHKGHLGYIREQHFCCTHYAANKHKI